MSVTTLPDLGAFVQGEVIDGVAALDGAHRVLTTYCVMSSPEAADAVTLWSAATHALPVLPCAPRLSVTSAVKRSGKTRVLEMVHGLSYSPLKTANATTAAVFRSLVTEHSPTLIFDEVDTIFGSRVVAERNEDLRGLLNAGFQRGWPVLRCVGPQQVPTEFSTFAMAALAGIGGLPDTVTDRAVNVRMRRRKAGEHVRPFRERRDRPALDAARHALTAWLTDDDVRARLAEAVPVMELEDRAADVWEPLIIVADAAGGSWPARARAAAVKLTREAADDDQEETLGVRLLHDLRDVFASLRGDWVPTSTLLDLLRRVEDAPWREMDLTAHRLGRELSAFGVRSKRDTTGKRRGYRRFDFTDAWERYPRPVHPPPDPASRASESVNTPPEQAKRSDTPSDASEVAPEASDLVSDRFRSSHPVQPVSDASDATPAGPGPCDVCGGGPALRFGYPHDALRCAAHNPMTYPENTT